MDCHDDPGKFNLGVLIVVLGTGLSQGETIDNKGVGGAPAP